MKRNFFTIIGALALILLTTASLSAAENGLVLSTQLPNFTRVNDGFVEEQIYGTDNIFLSRQMLAPLLFSETPESLHEKEATEKEGEKPAKKEQQVTGLSFGADFHVNSQSVALSLPLAYRPNFGRWWRRLTLVLTLPVLYKTKKHTWKNDADRVVCKRGRKWGLGDLSFGVNYLFRYRNFFIMPGYTIKFPTGDEKAEDNGIWIPMGSGSYDHIANLGLGFMFRKWRILANLSYRYNGETEDYWGNSVEQGGNIFLASGVEAEPFFKDWWLGFQMTYFYAGAAKWEGVSQPTDLHVFGLLLYTYYEFATNLRLEISGGYPYYTIFNENLTSHPKTGSWTFNAGFKFLF